MPPTSSKISSLNSWTIAITILILCQQNRAISATSAINNSDSNSASQIYHSATPVGRYNRYTNGDSYNIWTDLVDAVRFLWKKCEAVAEKIEVQSNTAPGSSSKVILENCLKRKSLLAIDRALNRDVISIGSGAVVFEWKNHVDKQKDKDGARSWVYPTNLTENNTIYWAEQMRNKILQFFKTRAMKIRLSSFNFTDTDKERTDTFEGRGRRKGNMMAQLMTFALVAAGIIVIPMGFQFLAVLGGKALLLAKLALLLTSIQGLKKIATSQLNYGLYSHGGGPCLLFLPIDLCETYRYLQDEQLFSPLEPYNALFDPYSNVNDVGLIGERPYLYENQFEHFGEGSNPYNPQFERPAEPYAFLKSNPQIDFEQNNILPNLIENIAPEETPPHQFFLENHETEIIQNIEPHLVNNELQNNILQHSYKGDSQLNYEDFNIEK